MGEPCLNTITQGMVALALVNAMTVSLAARAKLENLLFVRSPKPQAA
jgi:hypothetical protein